MLRATRFLQGILAVRALEQLAGNPLTTNPFPLSSGHALTAASKHRGYAFITFAEAADAQEAIDNYDLNELPGFKGQGKFLKCSIANPNKFGGDSTGKHDRACELHPRERKLTTVWESEEWIKENAEAVPDLAAEAAASAQNGA